MNPLAAIIVGALLAAGSPREVSLSQETFFYGMCDASAGVAITDDLVVIADDEGNTLRVYSRNAGGQPVFKLALDKFLEVQRSEPEADIEGAARVGDLIYFITSHSRNREGKTRPSRQRFFAVRIASTNPPRLEPVGNPCSSLLHALAASPELTKFNFTEASLLPPREKGGFNIEGLCARPDGTLLIGFRNPVPHKNALLVPLLNPSEIVRSNAASQFGAPVEIDLNGRGIRDIVQRDGHYYIVAGAYDSSDKFELYKWNGRRKTTLLKKLDSHVLHPEAILALDGRREFMLLSDDGSQKTFGIKCKDLPESRRRFRAVVIDLDARAED